MSWCPPVQCKQGTVILKYALLISLRFLHKVQHCRNSTQTYTYVVLHMEPFKPVLPDGSPGWWRQGMKEPPTAKETSRLLGEGRKLLRGWPHPGLLSCHLELDPASWPGCSAGCQLVILQRPGRNVWPSLDWHTSRGVFAYLTLLARVGHQFSLPVGSSLQGFFAWGSVSTNYTPYLGIGVWQEQPVVLWPVVGKCRLP